MRISLDQISSHLQPSCRLKQLWSNFFISKELEDNTEQQLTHRWLTEPEPIFISQKKSNRSSSLKQAVVQNIVEQLCLTVIENSSALHLLIFICAIEQNDEITEFVKENTDNFDGYTMEESDLDDLSEIVIRDATILNKTFSYCLFVKDIEILKYVVEGSK